MVFMVDQDSREAAGGVAERSEVEPAAEGRRDVEVPAKAVRRSFSAEYKRRIVEEADRLGRSGDIYERRAFVKSVSGPFVAVRRQPPAKAATSIHSKSSYRPIAQKSRIVSVMYPASVAGVANGRRAKSRSGSRIQSYELLRLGQKWGLESPGFVDTKWLKGVYMFGMRHSKRSTDV